MRPKAGPGSLGRKSDILFSGFLRQRSTTIPPREWESHAFTKAVVGSRLEDGSTNRAKRTQFAGVKCARRSRCLDCGLRIADWAQTCGRATNRAKQSQFSPEQQGKGKCFVGKDLWLISHSIGLDKTKPIPPDGLAAGASVPNKPNLAPGVRKWTRADRRRTSRGDRLCETNPIPGDAGRGTGPGGRGRGAIVRNEPNNSSIADCGLGTDLRREARPAGRGEDAKRTQFRPAGPGGFPSPLDPPASPVPRGIGGKTRCGVGPPLLAYQ